MKINGALQAFNKKFFDPELGLAVKSFNMMALTGIVFGALFSLIWLIDNKSLSSIIISIALSLSCFIALCAAEKWKCYHLCSWCVVVLEFYIAFPILFFTVGGYKSGMPCFFLLAINVTAILLDGRDRVAAVAIEFIVYLTCCLIAFYYPETVADFPAEQHPVGVMAGIVASSAFLLLTFRFRDRLFHTWLVQVRELNRELVARNETLTRYDTMKSDFLATVAHEISTPLAVIMACSRDTLDLLQEAPLDTDEILKNQKMIERRVKMVDGIVIDLMDTVAIENGRLSLNRLPVDMSEHVRTVCQAQFQQLDTNNNRIEYDLQPDLPHIWADPSRIEQVLTNLISNAVRHTKDGVITVRLTRSDDGNQIVCVSDNGEGMDSETARIVLKQYVSTKADHWRHGIGLYICRRIIAAHGGEIWIESEKSRGTSIYFSLGEKSYDDE